MLELDACNAIDYLRSTGRVESDQAHVMFLSGGVSNLVLRVEDGTNSFVIKQSRPQLRTKEAWFSDLDRVYRELEVMEALEPLLPSGVVPKVLWTDRENYLFAMSAAPAQARPWKELLLTGQFDADLAQKVGEVLGRIHQVSRQEPGRFLKFRDAKVFHQLRVDPFYRRVSERLPEFSDALGRLIADMETRTEGLCHGDFTPKNMLVHAGGFTLVDYETATYGDPAMDLGLCSAHLLLKAIRSPGDRERIFKIIKHFWKGHASQAISFTTSSLTPRSIRHLGACLLARIDGTSPVDYLPSEAQRQAVRELARILLLRPVDSWNEVVALADQTIISGSKC